MGAPAHRFTVSTIPDDEGQISAVLESWEEISDADAMETPLKNAVLVHDDECRGHFKVIRVSHTKTVVVCCNCWLRLAVPNEAANLGDLRTHFQQD